MAVLNGRAPQAWLLVAPFFLSNYRIELATLSSISAMRQSPAGWLVGTAVFISVSLFLFMISETLAHLRALAGGLDPFDIRPIGYDVSEARAFLEALGATGRDYYVHVQLRIDALYPATYAFSRVLLILWFALPGRALARGIAPPYKLVLLVPPAAACVLDWSENAGIATMLSTWPALPSDLVARTSALTVAKSAASAVTESVVIVLLMATICHRLMHRRALRGPTGS